jgi:hypothetical protein
LRILVIKILTVHILEDSGNKGTQYMFYGILATHVLTIHVLEDFETEVLTRIVHVLEDSCSTDTYSTCPEEFWQQRYLQ